MVYVPVKDDAVSTAKLEEWKDYLKRSGRSAIWEKLRFLHLPEPVHSLTRENYLEQLLWSDLGRFCEGTEMSGERICAQGLLEQLRGEVRETLSGFDQIGDEELYRLY